MTLQTQRLVMASLGVEKDQPPNAIQPPLVDGIHLRWMVKRDLGFPWYGFYLFRRPHHEAAPVCVVDCLGCLPVGPWGGGTQMATPYGQFTSDQPIVLTDDFPPPGVPEFDLDHRNYLRFTLIAGEFAQRVEVKVGFRRGPEPPPPEKTCVDFGKAAVGPGPNPRSDQGATFIVRDQAGNPLANTYTDEWASATTPIIGLFCGFGVNIELPSTAQLVDITLTHAGIPASVEAFNADGTTAGVRTMTTVARQPQTLTFVGKAIRRLRVVAPEDDTLLNELCFGTPSTSPNQVTVSALLGTTVVAQTVVTGTPGQVVTASLQFDAISAVQLSRGAAALVSLCFVPVGSDSTIGWEVAPDFRSPLSVPVLHPDYPPAKGAPINLAAAEAMAQARILYGPAAAWSAGFPDLHGELIALVTGGPGSTPMADRTTSIAGTPSPPDPSKPPPTMPAQHPLDLVLLGSLNPAVAQMLGLYWVDQSADPAATYDYLVVADHTGVGKLDTTTVLQEIQQHGFAQLDGWIVANQRLAPAPAFAGPDEVRCYALPGLTVRTLGGGLTDATNTAGVRWRIQPSSGTLAPGAPIAYHVWRDDLGDSTTPAAPTTYDLVTRSGPVLAAQLSFAPGTTPQTPSDWPPFPLDYVDAGLADGWYSYEVNGVDIFGRHSPNSGASAWYQWTPMPDPRPWYYEDPPADSVVHPFAVRLRDSVGPPPPTGIEAYALDPLDPLLEKDAAYNAWLATLSATEKIAVTGLRVRWLWPESLHRQAPRVREFRIYYQPGQLNVLLGRSTSVAPAAAPNQSDVITDIADSRPKNAYVGAWLRIGNKAYPIVGSVGAGPLQLTVKNIGPANDQPPSANRPCTISIPPNFPGFVDYTASTNWQRRYYVVDYNQHVTTTTDSAGKPLRAYEVFIPDATDTDRSGLPLAATQAQPIAYAQVGVSAADDRTYVADDAKWATGPWGGRYGREGNVGAPATILAVLRSQPPAPTPPADSAIVLATPADYHGHSFYTYRWPAAANLKAHVYRALDESVFKADWAKRPRATLQATDLKYFPAETVDPRWDQAKRQQVATELNQLNMFTHDSAGTGQALAYYRAISNDGLRVLAALDGNEAAFSQLTIQPLDPDDPAIANRVGPDNPPTYTIDPELRIYIDTLDGRSSNRYFYRAAYVNGAHTLGPLGLCSPPVGLPKVVPPRTPVITKVLGGDRQITISWASNREPDLAEYRIYRAGSSDAARDVRLMTLVHTETVAAGDPRTRPAQVSWIDTPLAGLVTYVYRITASDSHGNESTGSNPTAARATDEALPAVPALSVGWTTVPGGTKRAQAQWAAVGESLLQRQPAAGGAWVDITKWRPPGTYSVSDPFSDSSQGYLYRLWARKATGAIAKGAPVPIQAAP